jgi:hypothetical protein
MKVHVILLDVTPTALYGWLQECIDLAGQELAIHPLRPRPKAMIPYHVPVHHLYHFARELADWYVGIYESLPDINPPFGNPLLLLARLRTSVAASNQVPIGIWCSQRFPLDKTEIAWQIEKRLPSVPAPDSPLLGFVRPADLLPGQPDGWPTNVRNPSSASPAPAVIPTVPTSTPILPAQSKYAAFTELGRSSAPNNMAPSTLWLANQIAATPDPVDTEMFYQEWVECYRYHTGLIPRDSARSFDKATDSAFKHLQRTRTRRR